MKKEKRFKNEKNEAEVNSTASKIYILVLGVCRT